MSDALMAFLRTNDERTRQQKEREQRAVEAAYLEAPDLREAVAESKAHPEKSVSRPERTEAQRGFVRGSDKIDAMLQRPGMSEAVAVLSAEADLEDRLFAVETVLRKDLLGALKEPNSEFQRGVVAGAADGLHALGYDFEALFEGEFKKGEQR